MEHIGKQHSKPLTRKGVNMNKTTQNLIDSTSPFVVLSLPNQVELRQYWTKGGTYGPQVVTVIFDYPNEVWTYKTSGCGYCKQSQGLMIAWEHLGYKPTVQQENSRISHNLHVGGNFHKCDTVEAV